MILGICFVYFVFEQSSGRDVLYRWIGLAVSLAGLAGVIGSRFTLGRSFSVTAKAVKLVTTGLYSRLRNPIYVSGGIFVIGVATMLNEPVLWLLAIVMVPIQIVRAGREAKVLEAKFGDEYRRYRARTWF